MAKHTSQSDAFERDAEPSGAEAPEGRGVSRRSFFVRAGQVGGALLVAGPGVARGLAASPLVAEEGKGALEHGVLRAAGSQGPQPASLFSGLEWRMLGPFRGGRVDAVSGVVGRPNEFYFGSVNGGVWKTIDAGRVWRPVFDAEPVASIGALAVAPSAPEVVYVGSGESTLRDSVGYGNGMYKTRDGGGTWEHIGLEGTQHIGKVAVHPHDPDVVYVAAIGDFYGPSAERGVYRTKDGGRSWKKVLYRNEDVGAVEVVIDPENPEVIYAGLWNTRRPPWFVYAPSNGPGGGLFKSTDGGDSWTELKNGLPGEGIGRTGIAVCPSDPKRVYAVIDDLLSPPGTPQPSERAMGYEGNPNGQGGFFRSDDGGASWRRLSNDPALWGRGWYFETVTVDPTDADVVYVSNVSVSRSMDGGHTWVPVRGSPGGDDYHQAWVSPDDPNTLIVASDQGCVISRDVKQKDPADITWSSWLNEPIAQIYHVSVDYRWPYWVTGAQQDSGGVAVCSIGKFGGVISMRDWEPIGASGESGYTAGDPLHPGIVYGGTGARYDLAHNRMIPGTTAPKSTSAEAARKDWTQPLVLSAADPRALYYGDQFLFLSTDYARTWKQISPDLTRADPGTPSNLDAASAADVGTNGRRGVIYTICPSPLLVPMVWIGTDDGAVQVTLDNGGSWRNVTPPELTAWSMVTMVEASHFDFETAYVSVDRHQLRDFDPHIYRTRDMGKTWEAITEGLPKGVYVHVVKEDPKRRGMLFAGTERGSFISFDDGDHWQPLQLNLPVTSVRDYQVYDDDLIVATHGRGFWVIDDISALRQIDASVAAADAWLFKPADQILVDYGTYDYGVQLQKDEPQAENPREGVYIDYYLKKDAPGAVTLEILDTEGEVLATFPPPAGEAGGRRSPGGRPGAIPEITVLWERKPEVFRTDAGMHRVAWVPDIGLHREDLGLPGAHLPRAPIVHLPATFTAKLTVNGKAYTQTFRVEPDPVSLEVDEEADR